MGRNTEIAHAICAAVHHLSATKASHKQLACVLQPLPISEHIWEDLTMDFVEALPRSGGYDTVLVEADRLSKYVHFLGLKHPFTRQSMASLFIRKIVRLHEFPSLIVSDRDKILMNTFWSELFRLQGTTLLRSTALRMSIRMPPFTALYSQSPPSFVRLGYNATR